MNLSQHKDSEPLPVAPQVVIVSPLLLALFGASMVVALAMVAWFGWQGRDDQSREVVISAPAVPIVSEGIVGDGPRASDPHPSTHVASATATAFTGGEAATDPPTPSQGGAGTESPPLPLKGKAGQGDGAPTLPPTSASLVIYMPTITPLPSSTPVPSVTSTPVNPPDPLTGLPIDATTAQLRPYIAMIDNHPNAVPQSGLDKAAIVYEALAEGGITRFMAVFDGSSPDASEIGPIRSARVYYIEWAEPYQALYVHAGGSPAALDLLWHVLLINTDLLSTGPSWRSSDRLAPHNLYTSSTTLKKWMADHGTQSVDFSAARLLHKDDNPRPGPHTRISFDFGAVSRSDVVWGYDPTTNSYLRWMWGAPHLDRISGQQLSAKNVVIVFTTRSDITGDDKGRIEVGTSGSGAALFALDGTVVAGRWQKDSPAAPLRFLDSSGAEMQFNRGNTWIEALPVGQKVGY